MITCAHTKVLILTLKILRKNFSESQSGGVLCWIVSDAVVRGSETGTSFRQALCFKDVGFNLHDTMIWQKDSFSYPEKTRYFQAFEYMFILSRGKPETVHKICDRKNKYAGSVVHGTSRKPDGTTYRKSNDKKSVVSEYGERFNVWNIPTEKFNRTGHPAVFPKQLAKDHILSWSDEEDIVLDPFVGSGTTALAAIETNRHYIGFDISEDYCRIAENRIRELLLPYRQAQKTKI